MPATLYLIATPIGNLEDITLRALRILREEVSKIACEDTRQTSKLLRHYQIEKPLLSYHEHNEKVRTEELVGDLESGQSLALVSDAGTPLISDPGFRLVSAAIDRSIPVIALPGASAVLVALAGSGLPTDRFRFGGFLPPKEGARRKALSTLGEDQITTVVFESPHRILETLADIASILGDRPLVLARELTKVHEEYLRGTAASILAELRSRPSIKGEITLVIGHPLVALEESNPVEEVEQLEGQFGLDRMSAIKAVAKRRGLPKADIYRLVMNDLPKKSGRAGSGSNRDSD